MSYKMLSLAALARNLIINCIEIIIDNRYSLKITPGKLYITFTFRSQLAAEAAGCKFSERESEPVRPA